MASNMTTETKKPSKLLQIEIYIKIDTRIVKLEGQDALDYLNHLIDNPK